ncbi:MAG: peptidylprolyl isomerase [Gemmatimonadota bacterium]
MWRSDRPVWNHSWSLIVIVVAVLSGCGGEGEEEVGPATEASGDAAAAMAAFDEASEEERRAILLDPGHPEWERTAPPVWHARFETTQGDFVVESVRENAPHGVDRFFNLVRLGYYDDVRFHRVSEGYIVQWGLHGDPEVNRIWTQATIPDDPKYGTNVRGTFAYAQAPEPENRTTQIYVNMGDNTRNDGEPFAIFGRVVEGMEVLDSIYSGYGEESGGGVRQGLQGPIIEGGNAYLDEEFPLLDAIIRARVIDYPSGS